MKTNFAHLTVLCVLLIAGVAHAQGVGVDPAASTATLTSPAMIYVCPAGDGPTLASAGTALEMHLINTRGLPINSFFFAGFELDGWSPASLADGYLLNVQQDFMEEGFTALGLGYYRYEGAFIAGGHATEANVKATRVQLIGAPHALTINSPDITADGVVDLGDIAVFAQSYFGSYDWRVDFNGDGNVNLGDIGILAQHLGHSYPEGFIIDPWD